MDADPELTTASTITSAQFTDHIPAVLDAFEWRLSAQHPGDRAQAREEQKQFAAEHGLHRWQQGYNQPDTMREWGHLHLCLLQELESFQALNAGADTGAMQIARRELVRLCSEGVCASATRYVQLQQTEAASRVRDLESAMEQLQLLERERAQAWREAAHDLRGRAHAIASASAVLTREGVPEQHRTRFSEMLRLGVQSLNKLLGDLMDQARLEAGQERRQITHFDVALMLKEFCDMTRPIAAEKGLFLVGKGTTPLMIVAPTLSQKTQWANVSPGAALKCHAWIQYGSTDWVGRNGYQLVSHQVAMNSQSSKAVATPANIPPVIRLVRHPP